MSVAPEVPAPRIRVWDPVVRLCHWSLVLLVPAAWLTRHGGGLWHEWFGYSVAAVATVRLVWGWFGSDHARFSQFVHGPSETLRYAKQVFACEEPRHIGHNPLGAWMIVLLLVTVALVVASGWLYTTDRFWGEEWVETVHGGLSDVLLGLVSLHVAGVAYTSLRHRENLVAAMLHGKKRPEPPHAS